MALASRLFVLEAARAINALKLQPRRTIRIVLFTGEEQGEVGSREYVKQHQAEWNKISAVLADDTGTKRSTPRWRRSRMWT
jgi:carboxypeptidase Q